VEPKDFLALLQSLWGILAAITVLFPLSNVLIGLIPLRHLYDNPPGPLGYLSPGLITAVATIVTLSVILLTFGKRGNFKTLKDRYLIRRQPGLSFTFGFSALLFYFTVYYGTYPLYYEPYSIFDSDPRLLIGDFALLISYSCSCALVTKAFMLLAMIEYFGTA
jgi:hypothetical protein